MKSRNAVTEMTGKPEFANAVPKLVDVTTANDTLAAAIAAFGLNPGPRERSERQQAFDVVKGLYLDLCGFVQAASNGALAIIQSAGMEVRKSNSPVGQLPAPVRLLAFSTNYPGRIDIRWGGVKGRSGYNLFICSGDPNVEANWQQLVFTTRNRYTALDLTSDKLYYFRVNAIGAAGASPMSDVTFAKAA